MSKRAGLGNLPTRSGVPKRQKKLLAHLEKGTRLQSQGKLDAAIQCYDEILRLDPRNTDSIYMLAQVYLVKGEQKKAMEQLERCIKSNRDNARLRYIVALDYYNMRRRFVAIRHLKLALKRDPGFQLARLLLAKLYAEIGKPEQGRLCLAQGGGFEINDPEERLTHYNVLLPLECHDEAKDVIVRLIDDRQKLPESLYELTRLPGVHWDASHIRLIDELLSNKKLSTEAKVSLHFAAGRIANREARYAEAIAHFEEGNRIPDLSFDIAGYRKTIERICQLFQADYFSRINGYGHPGKRAVFIVGLPRSGKSLIERALSRHQEIGHIGELALGEIIEEKLFIGIDGKLPDGYEDTVSKLEKRSLRDIAAQYLRELDKYNSKSEFVLNSLPHNFQNIGFIKALFPNAKIIHVTRDPIDTCLFCFMKRFSSQHDYANDLGILGAYYKIYYELMAHWDRVLPGHIHQISYENFVTNPAAALSELLKYLDLQWEDDSLQKPLETNLGTFEPGYAPEPVNTSYVRYWKNYERHLAPLFETLGDLAQPSESST